MESKESILGKAWFPDEPSFWDAIQKRIVDGQVARRGRMISLMEGLKGGDGSIWDAVQERRYYSLIRYSYGRPAIRRPYELSLRPSESG